MLEVEIRVKWIPRRKGLLMGGVVGGEKGV